MARVKQKITTHIIKHHPSISKQIQTHPFDCKSRLPQKNHKFRLCQLSFLPTTPFPTCVHLLPLPAYSLMAIYGSFSSILSGCECTDSDGVHRVHHWTSGRWLKSKVQKGLALLRTEVLAVSHPVDTVRVSLKLRWNSCKPTQVNEILGKRRPNDVTGAKLTYPWWD